MKLLALIIGIIIYALVELQAAKVKETFSFKTFIDKNYVSILINFFVGVFAILFGIETMEFINVTFGKTYPTTIPAGLFAVFGLLGVTLIKRIIQGIKGRIMLQNTNKLQGNGNDNNSKQNQND